MEANKSITDFISEIKIDRSNLEHIAKTGKINGSLFLEIQDKMRAFASQELLCAIPDYESNKTAEAKKQEIISITEATVAAYSNAPVWYKQEIEKYMDTYASTLQKELDETKQKLQESEMTIMELKNELKKRGKKKEKKNI
jgi:hypothetical protein